jgi:hypothetical protein
MSDSKETTSLNSNCQEIHLQKIMRDFMGALQRQFDSLSFNLAARQSVQREEYERYSQAQKVMPSDHAHQNFQQISAYTKNLLTQQVLAESVNLAVTAINNAHYFLSLVKNSQGARQVSPELQKVAQDAQEAFMATPLEEKFNLIEQRFGIMCELEDSILGMGLSINALLYQDGEVGEEQLNQEGELIIELKAIGPIQPSENDLRATGRRLLDQRKIFRKGDEIQFSDNELQLSIITIASFANSLFKAVEHYANATDIKSKNNNRQSL